MTHIFLHFVFPVIDSACSNIPSSVLHKWRRFLSKLSVSDVLACFEGAKWALCNLAFPVCIFDKEKKIWKTVPICRESCLSYHNSSSCKAIRPDFHLYMELQKHCKSSTNIDKIYCFDQLNVTTPDCLWNIFGK